MPTDSKGIMPQVYLPGRQVIAGERMNAISTKSSQSEEHTALHSTSINVRWGTACLFADCLYVYIYIYIHIYIWILINMRILETGLCPLGLYPLYQLPFLHMWALIISCKEARLNATRTLGCAHKRSCGLVRHILSQGLKQNDHCLLRDITLACSL